MNTEKQAAQADQPERGLEPDTPEPTHYTLTVTAATAGQRLDRYIASQIATLSRSFVQALISDQQLLVNEQPTRASYTTRPKDVIHITIPPPQPTDLIPEELPLSIVYEDAAVVVVNKAAGMVVHPAPGHPRGTLVNALLARYPDMQVGGSLRPGIVHRLDQDTSGLLVVARTDQAMQILTSQQQARQMRKQYLAVVEGRMKTTSGVIDAPIGRHPHDRLRQAIVPDGRPARTHYRVAEELGAYTLLDIQLETGRTHQIRVHLASLHRPVLGDSLYGPRKPRSVFGLKRQFLHASRLGFFHPSEQRGQQEQRWCEFGAPLPDDLAAALTRLRRATPGYDYSEEIEGEV